MPLTFNINHINAPKQFEKNHSIQTLDVSPDFPISVSGSGKTLSIYSDNIWDITPYSKRNIRFNFDLKTANGNVIDEINLSRHKKLILWMMYAWRYPISSQYVKSMSVAIRGILKLCIDHNIDVSKLNRFPIVIDKIHTVVAKSRWGALRLVLQMIFIDRELLGFFILTNDQISKIDKYYSNYITRHQTPFIPERIFHKILDRCGFLIESYVSHQAQIEKLYDKCLTCVEQVRKEFGPEKGLGYVMSIRRKRIGAIEYYTGKKFDALVSEYELRETMLQIYPADKKLHLISFSSYLSHVSLASRILLAALTGMRDMEHGLLREGCHEIRTDNLLGNIHFLKGETTKTSKDRTAYWVTSPVTEQAIKAATSIAQLRKKAARIYCKHDSLGLEKQYLFPLTSDPWIGGTGPDGLIQNNSVPIKSGSLINMLLNTPNLLSDDLLRITSEDLGNATRMNPDLNMARFRVNEPWKLGWHQFRRTFVCLALDAGVTLPTLSWQLKHSNTNMTLYYGSNYFSFPMDEKLKQEFEKAQLEILLIKFNDLESDNYLTAKEINKDSVLRTIRTYDRKSLKKAILEGKIAIKNTALGVCTNPAPCEYGGWENVTECVKCANGLISKSNQPRLKKMLEIIDGDIAECDSKDILLTQSLDAQKIAILEALNAIN